VDVDVDVDMRARASELRDFHANADARVHVNDDDHVHDHVAVRLVVAALVALSSGCPGGEVGRGAPAGERDAGGQRADTPDGGAAPRADASSAPGPGPAPAAPAKAPPPACGLAGDRRELSRVLAADLVLAGGRPASLVVLTRPRPEPLDIEGNEPLPELRSLYFVVAGEGDDDADVVHLADDPGPVRDHFGRRAYERLAGVRGACDALGCLAAIVVERITPDFPGAAFTVLVQLLDDTGEPQGELRRLAQEPDRGEALSACLGVSSSGTLLATAVRGGRGRLLWLDRRAMPLDMRFVQGGFDSCSTRAAGMGLEVAVQAPAGITISAMGGDPEAPDAGPAASWLPSLPGGARLPVLATLGAGPAILFGVDRGVSVASPSRPSPSPVLDGWSAPPRWLGATAAGDDVVAAAVDGQGQLALARLGPSLEVVAASTLANTTADEAWVLGQPDGAKTWLGWRRGGEAKNLSVQGVECPLAAAAPAPAGPAGLLATADALDAADRRAVGQLRKLADQADDQDQHYRAAWLLERAYRLQPADHELLLRSAGHLTGIRYSKAALRQLERLSKLSDAAAQSTLHAACRDQDFERLWPAGEFQRITGCRAPAAAPPDAGPEVDEDVEESELEPPESAAPPPPSPVATPP
jgi:hypothetical protein